jgi:two-component system, NarL family, response regulator LiaR
MMTLAWTLNHRIGTGMRISEPPTRIMIVDDQDQVRDGLATFLAAFDDLKLVGSAAGGEEAITLCLDLKPDVVLMDLAMPHMNGVDATKAVRQICPNAAIIVLTGYGHTELSQAALQAGAVASLSKNVPADELASTIRTARQGQHHTA